MIEDLVNHLIQQGYLKTPLIIGAFKQVDRQNFVPEDLRDEAYINAPLPIGFGQTISQPLTVAFMLELLEPKAGDKILDIGAGSGWTVALLAQIVGAEGNIIGIECIPELQDMAVKNVSKYNFLVSYLRRLADGAGIAQNIVKIVCADGSKGYSKEAPYDRIIAGAAAKGNIPIAWRKQLKIGGRIVAPVENSIIVIDKIGKNKYSEREHFGFSFVPLVVGKHG